MHSECHDIEAETYGRVRESSICIDGTRVNYLDSGSGDKCVLLIHGGVNNDAYSTWFKWNRTIDVLSKERRVVAMDLPGYGLSGMPREFTQDYYVDFIGRFAGALGIGKADIVGTSMGAGLAIGYALRNSESVESLALISPYGLGFGLPRVARIALRVIPYRLISNLIGFLDEHKAFTRRVTRVLFGQGSKSMIKAMDGMNKNRMRESFHRFMIDESFTLRGIILGRRAGMRTDYRKDINRLNGTGIRTLFIQGENDTIVRLGGISKIVAGLRNVELDVVDGCRHSPHFQKPERVNADIVEFLEKNRDS